MKWNRFVKDIFKIITVLCITTVCIVTIVTSNKLGEPSVVTIVTIGIAAMGVGLGYNRNTNSNLPANE